MIKIIGFSGSRVKDGNMEALLADALFHAGSHSEVETELITLSDKKIGPCNHCNWCIGKQKEDRPCVQQDDMEDIYQKLLVADGIIVGSPAHFGRLSGATADLIDRTRAFMHGNVYHVSLKNKVGGSIAMAFFRGGGVETTLSSINLFFHSHRMIVANGLYQLGAAAFSTREGKAQFEPETRHMVLEDKFGTAAARALVDRTIELAGIVKAGLAALASG
jgi:multimeric flavodoxin WrbA